jgi:2'-5' RNA ligase
VAIETDPELRESIRRFQEKCRTAQADVKWVRPENIHLTLAFLGDIAASAVSGVEEAMRAAVQGVAPFRCPVEGAGAFGPARSPRVLWVGLRGAEPIAAIQSGLAAGLREKGHTLEDRPFAPHLTIGRVRSALHAEALLAAVASGRDRAFGEVRVSRLVLFRSQLRPEGPEYSVLSEAPLQS